ncbi:hypothetical protein AVHY2522_13745 [Acidovorax sp. SUPP2522]|uniref:hypothetical protein n=1 Tax=unclassified Acidovorax TaxID=2684926 RepID=UPI002349F734|nr:MULTISPECIES: hypothetical protein [unclassified Acidovorax]WCN00158.1 hypothetical protein M5C96_12575 [Acidovorax sp. GBBC 1281]GKT17015.1 hypothetical protein AVHY2522_13745 [Acidovorax sp. SUPP2522]
MLAFTLAGLPAVAAHAMEPTPAPHSVTTSTAPAKVCLTPTPADRLALQEDRQRVVIVLRAFEPPRPATGRLVASLLVGAPPTPREITRFAVHPLRAFTAAQPQRSQRFLVSLAGDAPLPPAGQPVCLLIGFPIDGSPHEGGRADLAIELFPTK